MSRSRINLLQEHYNRYRRDGGSHAEYVLRNDDIDEDTAEKLNRNYENSRKSGDKKTNSPITSRRFQKPGELILTIPKEDDTRGKCRLCGSTMMRKSGIIMGCLDQRCPSYFDKSAII